MCESDIQKLSLGICHIGSIWIAHSGLETYYFSNLQTFASGFNLNWQIAIPYTQLALLLFQRFIHPKCMQLYTFQNAKQASVHVHPKIVVKYLGKHWIGSSDLGQFSLLLSCQPYGLILTGTQLSSYWFQKLLEVNCWMKSQSMTARCLILFSNALT